MLSSHASSGRLAIVLIHPYNGGVWTVDPADPTPLYAQLDRGIRAAIAAGRLKPGDRLPTVRRLAVDLRVNANTVAKVYTELERAGVLATQRGIGTFVRDNPSPPAAATRRDRERELRLGHAPLVHLSLDPVEEGLQCHGMEPGVLRIDRGQAKRRAPGARQIPGPASAGGALGRALHGIGVEELAHAIKKDFGDLEVWASERETDPLTSV